MLFKSYKGSCSVVKSVNCVLLRVRLDEIVNLPYQIAALCSKPTLIIELDILRGVKTKRGHEG